MRKNELRAGMRVKLRHGGIYLVMTDVYSPRRGNQEFVFIREGGFMNSDEYNDDLTVTDGTDEFDVVEVFQITSDSPDFVSDKLLNLDVRHSIWKREEYSEKQKDIFKGLRLLGLNYIAKDKGVNIPWAYGSKPTKASDSWVGMGIMSLSLFPELLNLTSWENEEPFKIPEVK